MSAYACVQVATELFAGLTHVFIGWAQRYIYRRFISGYITKNNYRDRSTAKIKTNNIFITQFLQKNKIFSSVFFIILKEPLLLLGAK